MDICTQKEPKLVIEEESRASLKIALQFCPSGRTTADKRLRYASKFLHNLTNINDVTNNIIRWLIMINEREKGIITRCAKKYKVSSIYLFGSSLDIDSAPNDIDLAVEGIRPEIFFKFYGELLRSLSKPVDLVDLSRKSLFNRIIEEKGVKIYG